MAGGDEDEEEDEDEETLQLKLQEIQARLRLKKLQSAKSKKTQAEGEAGPFGGGLAASAQVTSRSVRSTTPGADSNGRPISQNAIQVPASPVRKLHEPQPHTSPSRVLLGIDKGLKAKDISLRRAPSLRKPHDGDKQTGGYLRRARTPNTGLDSSELSQPLSFNERLASVRTEETSRVAKQQRIQQVRTHAFGITQQEMEAYKQNAIDIPDEPLAEPTFSRDEIMSQARSAGGLQRSNTTQSLTTISQQTDLMPMDKPTRAPRKKKVAPVDVPEEEASAFEPYSSFHLSKRILPHTVLARHVSGKKIFTIKDLLRDVKSPDYALPDIEQDIVVFGILAKKSEPRVHKPTTSRNGVKGEDRGKYMVMTLVDLQWELELFLFNSGFDRFWKLTEGTVIAILNPNIMPPPPGRQDTGRFSIIINSDGDSIIEIGTARDLSYCQSVKKDGSSCGTWINKKKTKFCEFHSNEAIRKQRGTRIEMNGASFGAKKYNSREVYGYGKKKDEKAKDTNNYDRETSSHWFSSRSMSTADLIDGKDRTQVDRKERAEHLKRGLEAKEREREIMKKLGQIGNAAGREYMRHTGSRGTTSLTSSITSSQSIGSIPMSGEPARPDAKALGLLSRDRAVQLSPIKRKRADSSQNSSIAGSSRSLGWGSNLKDKLSKMKEGEKLRKEEEQPPVRKKTRFVTAKGIREAGRESLGNELAERLVTLDDDDDDDLIIVR